MNIKIGARSFNGGEVTPEFFGRVDDAKYQTGLALCENFLVLPHGPIANRAGSLFVRRVKTPSKKTRLLSFTWSNTQTLAIEFGEGYFRFHTNGATVLSGTSPYELAHPYTEAQLFEVQYIQSADVLTLVHPLHPPRELRRLGATNWTLVEIQFETRAETPVNLTAGATGTPTNPRDYTYGVTAVVNGEESLLSNTDTVSNNLDEAGTSNGLLWDALAGAEYYRVYRFEAGVMAFIGVANTNTFDDEGIIADVSVTPPNARNPFVGPGNYPSTATYFEQRRVFASTLNQPQTLWFTRPGTESNLNISLPVQDDDAINFTIAARERNTIRHLVPLQDLMVMTSAAEWRINEDITPTSINVKPQSFVGASSVDPLVTNTSLVFAAARGGHVRELGYSQDAGGYITNDLSLRATHLFDQRTIVDSALQRAPYPICWFVSSSGLLLGCTYLPEQNIAAWHRHSTQGVFESIAVVAEGEEDAIYAIVRRTINGEQTRYVERIGDRAFSQANASDCFFVDAGGVYTGPTTAVISSGLGHLEGELVSILADGAVQAPRRIVSGVLELDEPASYVVVGLPIQARAKSLPFAAEMQGFGGGRTKNVVKVWPRFAATRGGFIGPNFEDMVEIKPRIDEELGDPPALFTGEVDVVPTSGWDREGAMCIEQRDPLPMTLLAVTLEVSVGG